MVLWRKLKREANMTRDRAEDLVEKQKFEVRELIFHAVRMHRDSKYISQRISDMQYRLYARERRMPEWAVRVVIEYAWGLRRGIEQWLITQAYEFDDGRTLVIGCDEYNAIDPKWIHEHWTGIGSIWKDNGYWYRYTSREAHEGNIHTVQERAKRNGTHV